MGRAVSAGGILTVVVAILEESLEAGHEGRDLVAGDVGAAGAPECTGDHLAVEAAEPLEGIGGMEALSPPQGSGSASEAPAGACGQIDDEGTWLGTPHGWTVITVSGSGCWSGFGA